jgi:uncharacterized protein (UPF0261 family)
MEPASGGCRRVAGNPDRRMEIPVRDAPTIVVTGMCNTKGVEIRFLAEQVAAHGGTPLVMDLSLGAAVDWADIPLSDVLAATGTPVGEVLAAPRAAAIGLVGHAGAVKILELHAAGLCDGIISWAGAVGTTTATQVMRALPFGVPKVMLTDMAPSDVSLWLGNKDIFIVNPTAEQGVNVVTRRMVANATAAVVAMAREPEVAPGSRPLCAISGYGSTTPAVLRCGAFMEDRGWDTGVFHGVGVPGATMEDLIRAGLITALIDLTPAELMNTLLGSVYGTPSTWEGERLTAAGAMGIPQVVAPGGLDQAALGALEKVPQRYLDETRSGRRASHMGTGLPYLHNASVTIIVPTLEEVEEVSGMIADRLGRTTGPTVFLLPMQGWSAYDQREAIASRERGWAAGNGDGPTWEPDPEHPTWSLKASAMRAVLDARVDPANDHLDVIALDMHILDPEFSDLATRAMADMLDGSWRKGLYRDDPAVIG